MSEREARSIAIKALLDDPNVQDALKSIEGDLVAEWKKCHEPQERENLWRALNIMDRLETWLRSGASYDLTALRRQK